MQTIVGFSAYLFYISHYQRQQAQMRKQKGYYLLEAAGGARRALPAIHGLSPRKEKKKDKRVVKTNISTLIFLLYREVLIRDCAKITWRGGGGGSKIRGEHRRK